MGKNSEENCHVCLTLLPKVVTFFTRSHAMKCVVGCRIDKIFSKKHLRRTLENVSKIWQKYCQVYFSS